MATWTHPRGRTALFVVALVTLMSLVMSTTTVDAAPCWRPPVVGAVDDPFREPPCTWCAGNRGIEYSLRGTVDVRAAASGRVVFVGEVVAVSYVVVQLANGWRHTYGQLDESSLALGDVVLAGGAIGRATDRFFFGLRIGDDYADPEPYLGEIVGRRRLVPIDGSPARPAPPPSVRCRVGQSAR